MIETDDLDVMMENEIAAQIEALNGMIPGTEEHAHAVEDLSKLYKLHIDKARNNAEVEQRRDQAEMEAKNRKVEHWITAGSIAAQGVLYTGLFLIGLKFEEKGSLSSVFTRNMTNQIKLPKIGK